MVMVFGSGGSCSSPLWWKKKSRGKKEKPLPLIRHPGVGMVVCHLVSVYTCSSLIIKTQLVEKKKSIKKKNIP